VVAHDAVDGREVADVLGELVRKSLVIFDEGDNRYRMLESIREYANERLQEAGEGAAVRARHCDYFVRLVEEAEPALAGGPDHPRWRGRLLQEQDNLRAALAWSIETPGKGNAALRACGALYLFWISYAMLREGRDWCAAALAQQALAQTSPAVAAKALIGYGALAHMLGDQKVARASLEAALAQSRSLHDRELEGRVLNNLGVALKRQGDLMVARSMYTEAIAIARERRDAPRECRSVGNLCSLEIAAGNAQVAQSLAAQALHLAQKLKSPIMELHALSNLAAVSLDLRAYDVAESHVVAGLSLSRKFGFAKDIVFLLRIGGEVAAAQGMGAVARERFAQALTSSRQSGDAYDIASCIDSIAVYAARLHDCATSVALFAAADVTWDTWGLRRAFVEDKPREQIATACRAAMGDVAYDAAHAEGVAMGVEDAITLAFAFLAADQSANAD
jgi:non-specific serine/threonine protein kinase